MEPGTSVKTNIILILSMCLIIILSIYIFNYKTNKKYHYEEVLAKEEINKEEIKKEEVKEEIVYDNMTLMQLSEKLERNLNSTLKGKGYLYASYALELGLDPYLVVAISMHETGCKWDCSYLVKYCNNVGGQKGYPGCNGEYKYYETLDDGIRGFMDNLYYNYYLKGLVTPEQINVYYAEDPNWAMKVNAYIEKIKVS